MKPLVSIVTGTYNRIEALTDMVDSVRQNLSTVSYEIIVVDGGSTDGSIRWCKSWQDIRLIEHGELRGAVKAFNDGAYAAKGKYVIIANDDITFTEEAILHAITYMERHPECGVGCFYQDRDDKPMHVEMMPCIVNGKQKMCYYGQVCIVPRWLGDRVGWWGNYLHTYGGDNELSCRAIELGYKVSPIECACIHDSKVVDNLRETNMGDPKELHARGGVHPDTEKWRNKWTGAGRAMGPTFQDSIRAYNSLLEDMRILYLPIYEPGHRTQLLQKKGLREALSKLGYVYELDYTRLATDVNPNYSFRYFYDVARGFQPHLIVTQLHNADMFKADHIRQIKDISPNSIFVNWNGDYHPKEFMDQQYILLLKEYHAAGVVTTAVDRVYTANDIKWFYWQIGYEEVDEEIDPEVKSHDVVFLGNGYSEERHNLGRMLRNIVEVDVGLYGSWPPEAVADGSNLYDFITGHAIYRNAKIAISDNQWGNAPGFVSNRLFQAMYAGAFVLQGYFPEMDTLLGLENGEHLIVYKDIEEIPGLVRYWLDPKNDKRRKRIAKRGMNFMRKNHSFDVRVRELREFLQI